MVTIRAIAGWFDPRRRVIAFVLLVWAAIVVIGAGDDPDTGAGFALPNLVGLLIAAVVLVAMLGLAMLIYFRPRGQTDFVQRGPKKLRGFVILLAAVLLLSTLYDGPDEAEEEDEPVEEEVVETEIPDLIDGTDQGGDTTSGTDIIVLVLVGLAAGAVLIETRRQRRRAIHEIEPHQHQGPIATELRPVLDQTTAELRLGTDPRQAVMAAYANLEGALASRGHRRDPAETPTEHMARVFAAIPDLVDPAVRLGELYELARFSDHVITTTDRDRAADGLATARRSLSVWAGDS